MRIERVIQIVMILVCAAIGWMVWSKTGMIIGGVAGWFAAIYGTQTARQNTPGTSIHLEAKEMRELEGAMHIALCGLWAMRPMTRIDSDIARQVVNRTYDLVVEPYSSTITPHVQELLRHMRVVQMTGLVPEDSFRYVKRRYMPRIGRKKETVPIGLAIIVLDMQEVVGPTREMRDWFMRWCEEMRIAKYSYGLWCRKFGEDEDLESIDDWATRRRHAMAASYFDDDDEDEDDVQAA